jgi:hypothetical protein
MLGYISDVIQIPLYPLGDISILTKNIEILRSHATPSSSVMRGKFAQIFTNKAAQNFFKF